MHRSTARLVEFMLLARSGVPAPTAHLLSNQGYGARVDRMHSFQPAAARR